MSRAQTQVHRLGEPPGWIWEFRAAVSLHSHTCHSKEKADVIPLYVRRIPFLNRMIASSMKRYEDRTGIGIDFRRVYWTPPVLPRTVLASERLQIEELGLATIVSITDHDTISAPLSLRQQPDAASIPISVEWSVPFAGNVFDIGVRNLPPPRRSGPWKIWPASRRSRTKAGSATCWQFSTASRTRHWYSIISVSISPGWARPNTGLHFSNSWRGAVPGFMHWNSAGCARGREGQEVLRMAGECDLSIVAGGDLMAAGRMEY